jgi:hypothetical protein
VTDNQQRYCLRCRPTDMDDPHEAEACPWHPRTFHDAAISAAEARGRAELAAKVEWLIGEVDKPEVEGGREFAADLRALIADDTEEST